MFLEKLDSRAAVINIFFILFLGLLDIFTKAAQ